MQYHGKNGPVIPVKVYCPAQLIYEGIDQTEPQRLGFPPVKVCRDTDAIIPVYNFQDMALLF